MEGNTEKGVIPKIAPSMLSSDFANLASEAKYMMENGADWLHMDIMDGHFVPNLTIGAPVIQSLRKHTQAFLDCHLMVTNPLDYVEPFAKAGASGFTFHVEAAKDNWQDLIKRIRNAGMRPAVAVKPGTSIEMVYPLVESEEPVEMVLVMTVEPGFGGQKFMPDMMDKVRDLRQKYPTLDIEFTVEDALMDGQHGTMKREQHEVSHFLDDSTRRLRTLMENTLYQSLFD